MARAQRRCVNAMAPSRSVGRRHGRAGADALRTSGRIRSVERKAALGPARHMRNVRWPRRSPKTCRTNQGWERATASSRTRAGLECRGDRVTARDAATTVGRRRGGRRLCRLGGL